MTMADQVRRAILSCGLTQYEIAKRTGITAGGLSRFMDGSRDMNLRTLDKIAATVGISLKADKPKKKGR